MRHKIIWFDRALQMDDKWFSLYLTCDETTIKRLIFYTIYDSFIVDLIPFFPRREFSSTSEVSKSSNSADVQNFKFKRQNIKKVMKTFRSNSEAKQITKSGSKVKRIAKSKAKKITKSKKMNSKPSKSAGNSSHGDKLNRLVKVEPEDDLNNIADEQPIPDQQQSIS